MILSYQLLRAGFFTIQQRSLPVFEVLLTGQSPRQSKDFAQKAKAAYADLFDLLKKDSHHISQGVYPADVLATESVGKTLARFPKIVWDGVKISKRRKQKLNRDFSPGVQSDLSDYPEYFQRNFHFQTDGYLSAESAELYEHQVEILFSGSADAMRRLILPPLKKHISQTSEPKKLRILELGAGTGALSRFIKLSFPEVELTVSDLSEAYLKKAQKRLQDFRKINFVTANATDLPFQDASFDVVLSCFLFHELPLDVRRRVLDESWRVLRSGGWCGLVDSIQLGDKPRLDFGLESFPIDFHEPFFKNYTQHPVEKMWAERGFTNIQGDFGFFSKMVCGTKPT